MTRATRPLPPPWVAAAGLSAVRVMRGSSSWSGAGVARRWGSGVLEGGRAADDLADLLGDLGLAGRVRRSRERLDELVRVVRRGLHRAAARGRLGGRGLEHR